MAGRHDFTTPHFVSWGVLAERIFEAVVAAVLATPLPACQMDDAHVQALLDDVLSAPAPMRTSRGEIREVRLKGYVAYAQLDAILHPRGYLWWYGPVTSSVGVHGPTIWIQKRTT